MPRLVASRRFGIGLAACWALGLAGTAQVPVRHALVVRAGELARPLAPAVAHLLPGRDVPAAWRDAAIAAEVVDDERGGRTAADATWDAGLLRIAWLERDLRPGDHPRALVLRRRESTAPHPAFALQRHSGGADLRERGTRVWDHVHPGDLVEQPERAQRAFHRLYDVAGEVRLTKDHGGDFPHHRGLFAGWNRTAFAGERHDFWHCGDGSRVLPAGTPELESGDQHARVSAVHEWRTRHGAVAVRERRTLTTWTAHGGVRLVDVELELVAPGGPVHLRGDAQHAGVQLRAAQQVHDRRDEVRFLRSPGASGGGDDVWHGCRWAMLDFPIGDRRFALLLADGPDNPRPTVFSTRAYGRFGASFETTLEPGRPLRLRYRIAVLDGAVADADLAAALAADHASPVVVDSRASFAIARREDGVAVTVDGAPFATLRTDGQPFPLLWPVHGPSGVALTRAFPLADPAAGEARDHPHHRSLWFAHGRVNGHDFWHDHGRCRIVQGQVESLDVGGGGAVLRSVNSWRIDGEELCRDHRTWRFARRAGQRLIDHEIVVAAGDEPLVFGDTKEGTFAMRVAAWLRAEGSVAAGTIVDSDGVTGAAVWGRRARWVAYHAPTDPGGDGTTDAGPRVGVAMMDHPANPRHPTWWHARAYGLLAANPFGVADFEGRPRGGGDLRIAAGETLRLRHRVVLFAGTPAQADLDGIWRDFAGAAATRDGGPGTEAAGTGGRDQRSGGRGR